MNPRQIESFRTVLVTGSIVRAAELIHTSQPVASRLIGPLEPNLRLNLFEHDSQDCAPPLKRKLCSLM